MSTVAAIGLDYVGLPLAVEFGKHYETVGYGLSEQKIAAYRAFRDSTGELSEAELRAASRLQPTTDPSGIAQADFVVVALPNPVDGARRPDLSPLQSALATVGKHLKKGAIVVYESTVYPGATEDVRTPILERETGMRWKRDFHVGYSPYRDQWISPGDYGCSRG